MKVETFLSVFTLVAWLSPLALAASSSGKIAMTNKRRLALKEETKRMWSHGFDSYMTFAYPQDEIKPITCKGQGRDVNPNNYARNDVNPNAALTHLDSLSTIPIFRSKREFIKHIDLVLHPGRTNWDQDIKVQVFEVTIRVLGSLLSSYQQLEVMEQEEWEAKQRIGLVGKCFMEGIKGSLSQGGAERSRVAQVGSELAKPWIGWISTLRHLTGMSENRNQTTSVHQAGDQICKTESQLQGDQASCSSSLSSGRRNYRFTALPFEPSARALALLALAHDLGKRLSPAFDTPTGIPYSRVNLRHGVDKTTETPETCAAAAGSLVLEFTLLSRLTGDDRFETLARRAFFAVWERRSPLGLIGNAIEVNHGNWLLGTSTIGAGVDSFFEYALKAAIMLDDPDYLNVFNDAYAAVMTHLRSSDGHLFRTVNMYNGIVAGTMIDSLSAFWPGLQISAGDIEGAIQSHLVYWQLWRKYSAMPEAFNIVNRTSEWHGYPLRPEFVESTYHLYQATRDEFYLRVGERVLKDLHRRTWSRCGFAVLHDVHTGKREDRMESFMLSETLKYLYLLFDTDHTVNRRDSNAVFTTEAHLISMPTKLKSRTTSERAGLRGAEYLNSADSCPAYRSAKRGGLRVGIEGREDYDFTASLVDMPLLKNDGYWDADGRCAMPKAGLYSMEVMFSQPPASPTPSPVEEAQPAADIAHGAVSRIKGHIDISAIVGVKACVTLSEDESSYRISSVGGHRVHQGQTVTISDPSFVVPRKQDPGVEAVDSIYPMQASKPANEQVKYEMTVDADGRLTDVIVKLWLDEIIIDQGVGSTATFGVKIPPSDIAQGQVPAKKGASRFGLRQKSMRLVPPSNPDLHGCYGTRYRLPSDYPGVPWSAFVRRGTCTFFEKLSVARAAGASGAIVWDPDESLVSPDNVDHQSDEVNCAAIRPSAFPLEDDLNSVNDVGMVFVGKKLGTTIDQLLHPPTDGWAGMHATAGRMWITFDGELATDQVLAEAQGAFGRKLLALGNKGSIFKAPLQDKDMALVQGLLQGMLDKAAPLLPDDARVAKEVAVLQGMISGLRARDSLGGRHVPINDEPHVQSEGSEGDMDNRESIQGSLTGAQPAPGTVMQVRGLPIRNLVIKQV